MDFVKDWPQYALEGEASHYVERHDVLPDISEQTRYLIPFFAPAWLKKVDINLLNSNRIRLQPRSQGSLLPVPTERARETPWLGLVTWSQNKIISEGGVPCFSIFLSRSFSPFTPGFTQ